MKSHSWKLGIFLPVVAIVILALVAPTQAAAANPILVVTSASNPYTTFLPEILRTEGFNEIDSTDISTVTGTTLAAYDVVVLGDMSLTSSQATMFSTWVNGGGNLIALHPNAQLAGLLGLVDNGSALASGYMLLNTASGPGAGLVGQTIQFHGPAELYTLNGATSYATLYSDASTATSNPAVTLNRVGLGQAAAFAYDLARSVVYTRQGNPAWSGQARDAANAPPIRAYNLFYGAASFDPQADWVDFNKIEIPQADEQQRLLANLILQMNMGKKPLPRFWYLPKGLKAAVVMTGDDHGSYYSGSSTDQRFQDFLAASPSGCSVANWECVRGTSYLFPNLVATNPLTNSQVAAYIAQGFEFGVHVDSASDCQDWTTSALDSTYTNFLASFASQFPTAPAQQTHRMHCVSWSDYDSQPAIELKHGIRLDTTYYYWPQSWINDRPGLFTGSGMPMRYADRNGNLINVYQATTQMTDESGQSYPLHINTLLDNALSGSAYYGVFTANMHNDGATYPGPGANEIVASAKGRGVPIVTSLQMLQWLDGRNASSFSSLSWSGNVLSFSISVGANANNLRAMLPANFGSLGLSSLLSNGSPVAYQLQTLKGMQYAMFAAVAGSYQATYGGSPMFSISGAITPPVSGVGATVTAVGPVTVSASPDNYGNYSLNGLPSGTYSIIPGKAGLSFAPTSQVVTISGANVAAVNFNAVQSCPCSLWNTSVTPGTQNAADPNPVELGVRFTSDVAGTITALRFYKGSANTGTHIGNLWTNDGTLLATTIFTNETASGWQQQSLTAPVAITPSTTYVVSYHTDAGNYSYDQGYFGSAPFDNVPLHAPQDGSSPNGVYLYGDSGFPTSTYLSTNYYVDVVLATPQNSSISGTITGAGGSGATVTLSGTSSATVTADAAGNYQFSNLANGTYIVTPSNPGFSFTPASQMATVNNSIVTGLNFSTVTYSISGAISGTGGNGATVTLSGAASATVTASATGNYTFSNLNNGSYTVTPSRSGFTFTPASTAATVNNANVTGVNFSTATYTISGTISGSGGNGATVTLSGAASATVTASATGTYTFSNLTNGSYTVTPSKSGFTFTPASTAVTVNNANVTGVNFSTVTYTISGTISGTGGNAATVTLSGAASATVTASATGTYTFSNLTNGAYTVTPSKTGFTFTPASTAVTVNNASVANVNFATVTYTISGTISGTGGNAATVTLSGAASATVTASATGTYTFSNLTNGSYTVTPSKSGFTFTPASTAVTVNNANVTGVNFSTVTYTISGTISGTGGNAATVTLSGAASATVTASATGTYTFSNLTNGAYTVTPSKTGFSFTPASAAVTVNNANVTGVNFSTVTTFSISGTISNAGGNAATVTLSGAASATVTASATGTFTFSNLANGSYTVTPSKTGYIFTPVNRAVTVSNANVTGVNYTSTAQLAIDRTASTNSTGILTSVTSAAFTTTKTNELLLAMVSANGLTSGTTVSSVSGGGLTWTLVRRTNTQQGTAEIWRAFSANTLSNVTVRANFSLSTAASITVVTFSGVDTTGSGGAGAIGATGSASASSGAQSASLTTTRNNSWVLGVGTDSQGASSRTMGANQTMINQDTSGFTAWVQRQNSTTPTSGTVVTINDTAPTNHRYDLTICEVLPAQ